jgi:hypothetical protein
MGDRRRSWIEDTERSEKNFRKDSARPGRFTRRCGGVREESKMEDVEFWKIQSNPRNTVGPGGIQWDSEEVNT